MATLTFAIEISDAQLPRVQAAVRAKFGEELTNPQIVEALRLATVKMIKEFVNQYEDSQRRTAPIVDVDAT